VTLTGASYFGCFTGSITIASSASAGRHRLIAVGSDGARTRCHDQGLLTCHR
jgi:precorrin-6B methylase 2